MASILPRPLKVSGVRPASLRASRLTADPPDPDGARLAPGPSESGERFTPGPLGAVTEEASSSASRSSFLAWGEAPLAELMAALSRD